MKAEFTNIPDEVWERLSAWLPECRPHRKGGGPWNDDRRVMSGIVCRLKTGFEWDAMHQEANDPAIGVRRSAARKRGAMERLARLEAAVEQIQKSPRLRSVAASRTPR